MSLFGRKKGWKANGKEFRPLCSPLLAGSVNNIRLAVKGHKIDQGYHLKLYRTYIASALITPFRWYEHARYDFFLKQQKIEKDPLFILGHWRSGTTYLHNLLSQDPQMAYVSTYQSVFPELLGSKWVFRPVMRALMPKKRAADNVELNVKYPQEEEFGLGNMCHYCYYYFWLFPHQVKEYYNKFIKFKVDKKIKEEWKEQYLRLVKKAIYDLKRPRFISKNPPNTGRIPIILEMFPNAKFIYIKRDPITTFLSTKRFFKSTIPALQFQNINENELESFIVNIYHRLLKDYKFDKKQIPNGNLIEISYEEFLKQPLKNLKQIYHSLGLDGFFKAQSLFKQYINSQKNFKKKDYILSQEEFARIKKLLNLPDDYKPLNGIKVE